MYLWYILYLISTVSYVLAFVGDLLINDIHRIILGEDISIEKVPWQVSLHNGHPVYSPWDYFCSGAIIGTHEILTAGHCVQHYRILPNSTYRKIYARAGTTDRQTGGTVHDIINVTIHPDFVYNNCDIHYDLAVLVVEEPFLISQFVKSIEIADKDPKNGEKVMVSGWGRTSPVNGDLKIFPKALKHVNLTVWYKHDCFEHFGIPDVLRFKDDMKCLRNKPDTFQQTCEGDSGSPVVKDNKLVGILSGYASDQIKLPPDRLCGPMTSQEQNQISCMHPKTISTYNSIVNHKKWILKLLNESQTNREKL